ncbi:MAG TPA: amino acid transporter [Candidatus Magasanikbacteria bacterium]|nr:MAG: amino acid transporter [Candidatus Magasanikbacteria bacterium RIFOXYC2_FULL_39_8]HAT03457.1 amino acid transporter [Candidatus Magasanikbacteria bacterium]
MNYITLIVTVAGIHLLAAISPGPDFVMVVKNSLAHSRKVGIWTAVGFGLGIGVHVLYCLAGIAFIISQSIILFNSIKLLGAGYLIYIGIRSFMSKSKKFDVEVEKKLDTMSAWGGVRSGFLTNVLNPKVSLLFLGLFTLMIPANTPSYVLGIIGVIVILQTMLWFSFVATILTHNKVRSVFEKYQNIFNKTFGGLLVALGLKVALSKR